MTSSQLPEMCFVQSQFPLLQCGSSPTEPAAEHHGGCTASVPRPWSFPVQLWSDSLQETHQHSWYDGQNAQLTLLTRDSAGFGLTAPVLSHTLFSGEAYCSRPNPQSQQRGH